MTNVEDGGEITLKVGKVETVTCESRKSNPPPQLKWILGDKELSSHTQKNETEPSYTKQWRSYSVLHHKFTVNDSGKTLTCQAYHPGYTDENPKEISTSLNILCKL